MSGENDGRRKRMVGLVSSPLSTTANNTDCPMATETSTSASSDDTGSSSSSSSPPIATVARDQLYSILLLLPIESILCFAMTCKKFKSLAYSDTLWESLCRRDWGSPPVDALLDNRGGSNHLQLPWKRLYQQVYKLESLSCHRLLAHVPDGGEGILPSPRASQSLNLVSGCLVLFGGGCEGGRHLDDTWISYIGDDLRRGMIKWQKINSGNPSGRFGHSCVVVRDYLVLFGGINDLGVRQNDTWIGHVTLDPEQLNGITLSWRLLNVGSNAPPPRGAHAGCCINNRRMLVHGGIGHSGVRLGDTWILDLSEDFSSGTWKEIMTRPRPPSRSGHTITHIGGAQTILFGGRGLGYEVLNDIWLFDASDEGHWRWVQVLFDLRSIPQGFSLPRVGHSANLVIGRRLLIYGGEDSLRHRKDDFWALDIGSIPSLTVQPRLTLNPNRMFGKMWKRIESKGDKPGCRSFHGSCVDNSGRYLYVYGGMVDGLVQPADPSGLRFDGEIFLVELLCQP